MIDKYINDIKKEIDGLNKDKEIKKEEYDILNSKLEELKISFNNFNQNISDEEEKIQSLRDERSKLQSKNPIVKIFTNNKDKKLLAELNDLKKSISDRKQEVEEISVNIESIENKINELKTYIDKQEEIIKSKSELIENVDNIIEYVISNNPELTSDVNFMKELVDINTKYIMYDKTNNGELYIYYSEKKINEVNDDKQLFENIIQEINNPKVVEEGKYKVPIKYLFEIIRFSENTELKFHYSNCHEYFQSDGVFDKEYGEELERLYDDDNYYLGMHGTGADIETVNQIMYSGLMCNSKFDGTIDPNVTATAAIGKIIRPFVRLLSYQYKGNYNIIVHIPKEGIIPDDDNIKIWGSDVNDESQSIYLLPEYIYGYVEIPNGSPYDSQKKIIKNELKERKKYEFTYYDVLTGKSNTYKKSK